MVRLALPAALLLVLPNAATAQVLQMQPTVPPSGFGVRPFPPGRPLPPAVLVPPVFGGGIFGGFIPPGYTGRGFPFSGVWGGYGGWFPYYPYAVPVPAPVVVVPPAPAMPERTEPTIVLANEFPATLTVEFPAAAEVWVNGTRAEGAAATEWTLKSPVLKAGGSYTFEVKARWTAGGKTYEAERSVQVAGGNRSRVLVVAGTPVKE